MTWKKISSPNFDVEGDYYEISDFTDPNLKDKKENICLHCIDDMRRLKGQTIDYWLDPSSKRIKVDFDWQSETLKSFKPYQDASVYCNHCETEIDSNPKWYGKQEMVDAHSRGTHSENYCRVNGCPEVLQMHANDDHSLCDFECPTLKESHYVNKDHKRCPKDRCPVQNDVHNAHAMFEHSDFCNTKTCPKIRYKHNSGDHTSCDFQDCIPALLNHTGNPKTNEPPNHKTCRSKNCVSKRSIEWAHSAGVHSDHCTPDSCDDVKLSHESGDHERCHFSSCPHAAIMKIYDSILLHRKNVRAVKRS